MIATQFPNIYDEKWKNVEKGAKKFSFYVAFRH